MTDMIQTAKEKVVALIREQNNILNEEESVGSENRQPLSFFESTI